MKILAQPCKDVDALVIQHSKFIPYIYFVESVEDVAEKITALKKIHPNAVHFCYAYRIGDNAEQYRANDDGEPSGSAGLPILNQLISKDLTNALLVVVRYFGGIKLGVSGLIKAYKSAAQDSLAVQEFLNLIIKKRAIIKFPIGEEYRIYELQRSLSFTIIHLNASDCEIEFEDNEETQQKISRKIQEIKNFEIVF